MMPGRQENIVGVDVVFPSTICPWLRLAKTTGCEIRLLETTEYYADQQDLPGLMNLFDMEYLSQFKEWQHYFNGADFTDIKTIESGNNLRTFIAAMLSYYPWWIVILYRVRALIVRVLGLVKHQAPEELPDLAPGQISFTPGDVVTFFIVRMARENIYWFAETPPDKHLKAHFGIIAEPLAKDRNRYYIVTIVHYLHWTGPVYFNLIRPFHHLVVTRMVKAGARTAD